MVDFAELYANSGHGPILAQLAEFVNKILE